MEQSIIDFASQQEIFCAEFKRSLDAEVERRHSDLGGVSSSLSKMLETQLLVKIVLSTSLHLYKPSLLYGTLNLSGFIIQ